MNLQRVRAAFSHISRLPEVVACLGAMQQGPEIVASYVGLKPLRLPFTAHFRNGISYRLEEYYDLETLWQINFHEVYPLRPSDQVIVDAGANVGLFTCWAASRNRQATIVAVEPSPGNFERLLEHVRTNGFEDRVLAFQVALSSGETTAWLSERASASQMLHLTNGSTPGDVAVQALSLTGLLARVPQKHIDFLKMDIEGSEYAVLMSLSGDQLARIRRISVEYHLPPPGSRYNKTALIRHLSACGYRSIVDRGGDSAYGMIHASREQ
jgi:FkbM family methyltransferase